MAGRPKAEWIARVRSIGRALVPGEGIRTHVRIVLERDETRDVSIYLTLEDARKWRDALDVMVRRTESDMGITRCPHCDNMLSPDKTIDYCQACGKKVTR